MSWQDQLGQVDFAGKRFVGASFRGVPFFVERSERSGGRRTVVHEFPQRDDPFVEDIGRRARKFPVTGYVIGDDYLTQKNALLSALEDVAGPGRLLHPYYGERRAICDTYKVSEAIAGGGMATFDLDFVETPVQTLVPVQVTDSVGKVSASATAARTATSAELVQKFQSNLPAFALASAQAAVANATAGLVATLGPIITTTQELAGLNSQAALLTASAAALVRTPATLLTQFGTVIDSLADTAIAAPGAMMAALVAAYDVALGLPVQILTSTRALEAANQAALTGALRRVMAIEAARLAPTVPYASLDEATAARDQVAALLDAEALGAGDTAYPALVTLRADVMRAVPGPGVLALVVTVTRRTAIPSLLLTYQLYGSVAQEPDVIARNRIKHPGFVAGDLKVLSNG